MRHDTPLFYLSLSRKTGAGRDPAPVDTVAQPDYDVKFFSLSLKRDINPYFCRPIYVLFLSPHCGEHSDAIAPNR